MWLHLLKRQQTFLPLLPYPNVNTPGSSSPNDLTIPLLDDPLPAVEAMVTTAHRTARLYSMPRRRHPGDLTQLTYKLGALVGLRLLGPTERWLVAVYTDGAMGIWDLGPGVRDSEWWLNDSMASEQLAKGNEPIAVHVQQTSRWTSFEAAFQLSSPRPDPRTGASASGEGVHEACVYVVVNESL